MPQKYSLAFDPDALKEWRRLDESVKKDLKKILEKRLENPKVESARLSGELHDCFKIKATKSGFRLVYTVIENQLVVLVIAVAKRENLKVYKKARSRK